MSLAEKHCVACEGGVTALPTAECARLLKEIPGWQLVKDGLWLRREFSFRNWKQAMAFTNGISEIAESEKHHPDLEIGWGYCNVSLQTHAVGGLHDNDFVIAARISALHDAK